MAIGQWSTTAGNNATADPSINWQEGQAPSTVNDSARAMMAAVATWYQGGPEWLNYVDTITFISGTQFSVPGNLTARYSVGRRIRASVTAGTVYGVITASAYTSVTTVTVAIDSGSLDSGLSEVDVGILNPAYSSIPSGATITDCGSGSATFVLNGAGNASYGASIRLIGQGSNPSKTLFANGGNLSVANDARSANIFVLDNSGNLTLTGSLTATNLTASSDERLKQDWQSLSSDFLTLLAGLKCGTFGWLHGGERSVGVPAQALREFMPEAIREDPQGYLSVAYGNAALVACVELAKEVLALRSELNELRDLSGL